MNSETFNEIVKDRLIYCEDVLGIKNAEYSSDFDRLHNFKKAGRMKGQDPIQALEFPLVQTTISAKNRVKFQRLVDLNTLGAAFLNQFFKVLFTGS